MLKQRFILSAALTLAMVPRSSDAWAQSTVDEDIVGYCAPSVAEAYLNENNVLARIPINGQLFYRGEPHVYSVPRFSGSNALFSSSIMIGGLIDDQVHVAATRYGPAEFWAGPLDDSGLPPADCGRFDRIYNVRKIDVEEYERSGVLTSDLAEWPTGLGAPTLGANGLRIDVSHLPYAARLERVIDLEAGERPEIIGDQALWWIINDRGNVHEATDYAREGGYSPTLGIEVHGFAYVLSSSAAALNNATFYRFTAINRNSKAINKTYFGIFLDPDLGDAGDDYVGSDSLRNTAYVYNADDMDTGGEGYGRAPPAVGYRILNGPLADDDGFDNDRDGLIDEWDERPGMSHFLIYNNGGGPNEDPSNRLDYYNFFRSIWKNGNHVLYGGDGFETNVTQRHANYMYPGDPVTGSYWSEMNTNGQGDFNTPSDRRFILSSGPFDLLPGQAKEIDFAVVYGRGADNLDSITEMRRASDAVQIAFDANFIGYPPGLQLESTVELISPLNGVTGPTTGLTLDWKAVTGAVGYNIEVVSGSVQSSYDAVTTHFDLQRLTGNALYFWRVRTATNYGSGPWSAANFFVTGPEALGDLAPIAPYDRSSVLPGNTVFRWVSRSESVRLQISESVDFEDPIVDLASVSPGLVFPTLPFKRYFWRVWTEQDGWSEIWTFTTLEKPGTAKDDAPVAEFRIFPNPVSESTTIQFYLRESSDVHLMISDYLGRRVMTVLDRFRLAGMYFETVEIGGLANGVYFYTLRAGGRSVTKTMVVAR